MSALPAESNNAVAGKSALPKLARKRLVRFVTLYPKAMLSDAPDTVHDLRVASRRLQQVLRLLAPDAKSAGEKKLQRRLRKVRRAFGACRNLDVCISLIESKVAAATTAPSRQAWDAVKQWLEEKRALEIDRGRAELRRYDLVGFVDRGQKLIDHIATEPEDAGNIQERVSEALSAWRAALNAAQETPDVEQIHAFRIAGKRLRYCVESLIELGRSSVKPMVADLKALQDDLGAWHDHAVLREHVAKFIGRPGFLAAEPGMCRGLLLEMEREKQRDQATLHEAIAKAVKLAEEWPELNFTEPEAEESEKDQ